MSELRLRLRRISLIAVDRVFAACITIGAWIEVSALGAGGRPLWIALLLATGYTVPFAFRRRHIVPVTLCVCASVVVMAAFVTDTTRYFAPFLAAMVLAYSAGAYAEGRVAYSMLAAVTASIFTVTLFASTQVLGDYLFPTSFGVIGWLAGRAVRTRTLLTEELHEAAVREQEAHEREAAEAAAEERRRIAREMHDVVAHSVSVMVVQAGGARRILARDPERAIAAAAQIERTGRDALAEMRRLLGVLHHEDASQAVLAPQPSMAEVRALVERARAAGLPVELHESGERRSLPAGLDLAAYRVVQEGLTNALKYAAGAETVVRVEWSERELGLEVADRGPGPARERLEPDGDGGHGLVGMRERVRLYGGEIEAGRRRGGGFRIRAKLPLVREDEKAQVAAA